MNDPRHGAPVARDRLRLDEPGEAFEVETSDENRRIIDAMLSQAQRSIEIVSRHLDPVLYDRPEFTDAVKRMVLEHRRARVRILVQDPRGLARRGHRLVELAQRLSSSIEIRKPSKEHEKFNAAVLVVDGRGSVHRIHADRYEATVNFGDRRVAAECLRTFDGMWETARPDSNLQRLHL